MLNINNEIWKSLSKRLVIVIHMFDINNEMSKSNMRFMTIHNNLLFFMCVWSYSSFVYESAYANVCFKTTSMYPRSVAGVPFDSVRRFRASLLLYTTFMHLYCNWVASCVAAQQIKNQKPSPLGFFCRAFCGTKACGAKSHKMPHKNAPHKNLVPGAPQKSELGLWYSSQLAQGFLARPLWLKNL